jgi:hypothetical protein
MKGGAAMRNRKRELLVLGTVFVATGVGVSLWGMMAIMNVQQWMSP